MTSELHNKAFTLIELLLVIGIIGVLVALVSVMLLGAQDRAVDTAIKAALVQARPEAVSIKTTTGSFVASGVELCATGGGTGLNPSYAALNTIQEEIENRLGGAVDPVTCQANVRTFCIMATLSTPGLNFCIDSVGQSIEGSCTFDGTSYSCAP